VGFFNSINIQDSRAQKKIPESDTESNTSIHFQFLFSDPNVGLAALICDPVRRNTNQSPMFHWNGWDKALEHDYI